MLNPATVAVSTMPPGPARECQLHFEPWELSDSTAYGGDGVDRYELGSYLYHFRPGNRHAGDYSWPEHKTCFLSDLHADYEAFVSSLLLTGGVTRTGSGERDFVLTREGLQTRFIIGGDCLDKGPSNLQLLTSIRHLMDLGAQVHILAGNHDLRFLLGLRTLSEFANQRHEHFFLRMGPKVIPLLKEVYEGYGLMHQGLKDIPDEATCRQRLYPAESWFESFPVWASETLSAPAVTKELARMREKFACFEDLCIEAGMGVREVYSAAQKCHELFLDPAGEFAWFYDGMELAHRDGALLFVHAGLDDQIAGVIESQGVDYLNKLFWQELHRDSFEFYFGPLANVIRTKYRDSDQTLTEEGVAALHRAGIYAVVHGHQSRRAGQRITMHEGLLHIECDITMDRHSREQEGLVGKGAGATIICPEGQVIGISTDYPYAKVLDPLSLLQM